MWVDGVHVIVEGPLNLPVPIFKGRLPWEGATAKNQMLVFELGTLNWTFWRHPRYVELPKAGLNVFCEQKEEQWYI